jgi:ABC-type microcin C transport system permease subunit YejE
MLDARIITRRRHSMTIALRLCVIGLVLVALFRVAGTLEGYSLLQVALAAQRVWDFSMPVALVLMSALALALCERRLVRWIVPIVPPECPRCGYSIQNLAAPNCPECNLTLRVDP